MGYALLWLETAIGELLLLTTLVALIGRIKRPRLRTWLLAALVVVALTAYAAMVLIVEWAKIKRLAPDGWGNPVWLLAILLATGVVLIAVFGSRPTGSDRGTPAASRWPWAKLAVALLVVLALNMMTFWNLDAAVHQRVASLRVEAGALALSVAPPKVSDRDNAAVIYERVFELMGPQQAWDKRWDEEWTRWLSPWLSREGDEFDPENPEFRKFLEDQTPALPVLRGVVKKPACYFRHDYARPDISMLLPDLGRIRHAAWLLALDSRHRAAAGDFEAAIDDVNAIFVMAEHAGTVPAIVGMRMAGELDGLAIDALDAVLASGHVPVDEVARVQVPASVSYRRLFDRATVMEEALGLSGFYEYGAPLRLEALTGDQYSSDEEWLCSVLAPFYRVFLLDDDAACYRAHMADAKRMASRPYCEVAEEWKAYGEGGEPEVRGLLTNLMLPKTDAAAEDAAWFDARHRLAQFAKAVALLRPGTGEFPDDLDPLALTIRLDPFDGKPLKWTLTDEAVVLYSIGPDLIDDGGKPFERESKTGDLIFTLPK